MFPALFILCVGVVMMWLSILIAFSSSSLNTFYIARPLYKTGYLIWAFGNILIGLALLEIYS